MSEMSPFHAAVWLRTKRLTLTTLSEAHIEKLNELDADPDVMHFITNGKPRTPGHNEAAVPRLVHYARELPGLGLWPTYLTEAGKALIQHGFETLGLERIIAIVRPDNLASQAVIKKIGLAYEDKRVFHGMQCLYFSLDRSDFQRP
jgi:RimJ/RimL family protein N-acetyltransferase